MKVVRIGEIGNAISGPVRDEFISALLEVREGCNEDITLDFSGVNSLSSISLAAVGKLHTWMEEHGRNLYLVNLSDHIHQLFTITGLAEILNMEARDPS
ncbi:MAG: STAS domain-containing protein [Planctomycetota bacterium]|jgi:anti-anti-sigma factor